MSYTYPGPGLRIGGECLPRGRCLICGAQLVGPANILTCQTKACKAERVRQQQLKKRARVRERSERDRT